LIVLLIDTPAFPPVTGSKNPNDIMAKRESNGQDSSVDPAETIQPLLAQAMRQIFRDHPAWVSKGELGLCEGDSVFALVFFILLGIPLESGLRHG
jgi:hypothetical protein